MTGQAIVVRPLEERDLAAADRVMRVAFGTFVGAPEPATFMGDAAYVHHRWRTDPAAAFAAETGGEIVGSNFAINWGSVGFFGPLSIRPDWWDRGIGSRLVEPAMACFAAWKTTHAGLYTFAQSQKHVGLYQKFGFWPRFLTALMSKPIETPVRPPRWSAFSELSSADRRAALDAARELTDAIFSGLDVSREMHAVAAQSLGETVLAWNGSRLLGFAVCHCGPGTEAGSGNCYVKFAAAAPGHDGGDAFDRVLDACEAMAARRGLSRIAGGMNLAREEAYRRMLARGFRVMRQGVAMHRPNEPGYNRPGIFVVDDWR